jgi:hypothetical protein
MDLLHRANKENEDECVKLNKLDSRACETGEANPAHAVGHSSFRKGRDKTEFKEKESQ